jgi:hypothetical protein
MKLTLIKDLKAPRWAHVVTTIKKGTEVECSIQKNGDVFVEHQTLKGISIIVEKEKRSKYFLENPKSPQKKVVKKTYKLWITIEEHTEFSDGSDKYRDMKEEDTRSLGTFSTVELANEHMNFMGDNHQSDGDVE